MASGFETVGGIFTNPVKTLRKVAADPSEYMTGAIVIFILYTLLASILGAVKQAAYSPFGSGIVPFMMLGSVILLAIGMVIGISVILIVGKLFKGRATFKKLFVVTSYTLSIGFISLFADALLSSLFSDLITLLIVGVIVFIPLAIWGFILSLIGIREAHHFTGHGLWKAFFTMVIGSIVIFVFVMLFFLVVSVPFLI